MTERIASGRTGRRPGAPHTREGILAAAREVFAVRGYDGATVRRVAWEAGVDPRLIYHYFGSKEQLFVTAMELPDHWWEVLTDVLDGPDEEIGERLVLRLLGYWEDPETNTLVRGIIRSGMTSPMAAEVVRRMVAEGPFEMLAAKIAAPDRELRVMCIASQVMGVATLRYVLRIEPLASAPVEQLAAMIGPTVQHHLMVQLGEPRIRVRWRSGQCSTATYHAHRDTPHAFDVAVNVAVRQR